MTTLPASWWAVLALSGAGFVLLWWAVRERPRSARIRAIKRRLAPTGGPESPAEQAALHRLRRAPRAALRAAKRHGATVPTPRFLFMGDTMFPTATTDFWQWTVLPAMVAITIAPQTFSAPDAPSLRRAWGAAARALLHARRRVPLNGIVVCVDARRLRTGGASLQAEAAGLRRWIDEVVQHLGLQLPIYLVVTGLEQLDGYDVVRAVLPDPVRAQMLGQRLGPAPAAQANEAFEAITARLRALRMALLRAHPAARDRLAIHAFVEAVRDLGHGLDTVASTLFAQTADAPQAQPWYGLYLTGNDPAGGTFSDDLFARFLPADEPLATPLKA